MGRVCYVGVGACLFDSSINKRNRIRTEFLAGHVKIGVAGNIIKERIPTKES